MPESHNKTIETFADAFIDLYARVFGLQEVLVRHSQVNPSEVEKASDAVRQQLQNLPTLAAMRGRADQRKLEDLVGILRTKKK